MTFKCIIASKWLRHIADIRTSPKIVEKTLRLPQFSLLSGKLFYVLEKISFVFN